MLKRISIVIALLLLPAVALAAWQWNGASVTAWNGAGVTALNGATTGLGADTTPPTVSSITIGTNGTSWTFGYSEAVTCATTSHCCDDFTAAMTTAGAITLSYSSGSTTNSVVCTGSPTVNSGDTVANGGVDYTTRVNGIEDAAGNDLASFTDKAVTNNSTQGAGITEDFAGTLGNWDTVAAGLAISSGTLVASSTSTAGMISHKTSLSSVNMYLKLKVTTLPQSGDDVDIGLRFTNGSSPWIGLAITSDGSLSLYYTGDSAFTGYASYVDFATFGLTAGQTIGVTVSGTGTSTVVSAWKNPTADAPTDANTWDGSGAGVFTYTLSAGDSKVDTGNKILLLISRGTGASGALDDVKAGSF